MPARLYFLMLVSLVLLAGCKPGPEVKEVEAVTAAEADLPQDVPPISIGENDWPWWRGVSQTGIVGSEDIPTEWGPETNVVWKTEIPGRGHASPTIVGDRIYLATADERAETQSVLAYDKLTGEEVWQTELHSGGLTGKEGMHPKSSHASSTIACDGERLFAIFLNNDRLHATALDLEGEIVWQETVGDFSPKFGYAPSPVLYESLVIFAADNWGGGYISAHNRLTGELVWRIKRPAVSTYSTPVIVEQDEMDLMVISGCEMVAAYDPLTGTDLWSTPGTAEATVGTPIWEENKIVASGGYPDKDTICLNAETGEALWHVKDHIYVPSMVVKEGYVYAVTDKGIGFCWSLNDGKEQWKARIGGNFSASPVIAGDKILITDEQGTTVVFEANPEEYVEISKNKLGDSAFATPTVVGNRIYLRTTFFNGGKQEMLYCIGNSEEL
ncbi:MAG: PQQ-binding-like beta-propeller repeat protein [Planctomycetaceae bacterium]|nr:PQQ-binding-like beta-propeller repeat protein [Planctomycetaceae bacterium]